MFVAAAKFSFGLGLSKPIANFNIHVQEDFHFHKMIHIASPVSPASDQDFHSLGGGLCQLRTSFCA